LYVGSALAQAINPQAFSRPRPEFHTKIAHAEFLVDKEIVRHGFSAQLSFRLLIIIPPRHHSQIWPAIRGTFGAAVPRDSFPFHSVKTITCLVSEDLVSLIP
jgi:hypothetical protein